MRSLILLPLLAACAASGTQVTEQQLHQFRQGHSTVEQVTGALGQPNSTVLSPAGRVICYTYSQVTTRPESFIPYVGLLAGGADMKFNSTCFNFDRAGVLQTSTMASNQVGSGYGLESHTPVDDRIANEPRR